MEKYHKKDRKKVGRYDWHGSLDPEGQYFRYGTFSVGIFQWLQGAGKMKKGKVVLRIKGDTGKPTPVYDAAETWCDWMDKGKMPDIKTLNLGFK